MPTDLKLPYLVFLNTKINIGYIFTVMSLVTTATVDYFAALAV